MGTRAKQLRMNEWNLIRDYKYLGAPTSHNDLNDQNLFHSIIDTPPGMPGVSKNQDDQTEVHSGELDC